MAVALAAASFFGRGAALAQTPVLFAPDVQLSAGQPASLYQVEPAVAVNPRDPGNFVAGYFGRTSSQGPLSCLFAASFDEGATWAPGSVAPLGSVLDDCFDPSLAAGSDGTFYYAYLDVRRDQGADVPDIRVARSTDGGRSFPATTRAVVGGVAFDQPEPDKPWIAVDNSARSRFRGSLYVSFTDFVDLGQGLGRVIRVVVSRDGGNTWSGPAAVSRFVPFDFDQSTGVHDSDPVIAPDGTVYVFYIDYDKIARRTAVMYARSRDGGRSWDAPAPAEKDLPSPGIFWLDNGDPKFGTQEFVGLFASSAPTAAVAPDGTLFVAWTDFPNGSCVDAASTVACRNADVRLTVSKNGGKNWSAPVKISDDATTTDQFFPWIATHPDGLLSLVWLDRRLDPTRPDYDAFYTNTRDGRAFLPNLRVSTETSHITSGSSIGDYNNLAVTDRAIVPVWNDTRSNTSQIFAARGILAP